MSDNNEYDWRDCLQDARGRADAARRQRQAAAEQPEPTTEKPMTLKTFAMSLTIILDMPPESSYGEIISKVATLAAKR